MMSSQYLFGDSDLAAHRLEVLADVYADSTTAFLREAVTNSPRLAIDLGCGPGFTTRLLADTLKCEQAVGLDSSEHFISLAKKTVADRISFYLHDVTSIPFPAGPADVIFCRYLLTHLQQPHKVVSGWATQLCQNGLLLMEEVDYIHTDNETLALYLNIVDAMLERQSGELYVGRVLDALEDTDILRQQTSKVRHVPVATRRAAAMFYLNIQTWKHQPFIQANYPAGLVEDLQRELNTLASRSENEIEIEWGLRQIVFKRAG